VDVCKPLPGVGRAGEDVECARGVAVQVVPFERAKFVTGFSRWVKGQAQGLEPGAFKLWVNCIRALYSPTAVLFLCSACTIDAST
jgi:hypothetical protein